MYIEMHLYINCIMALGLKVLQQYIERNIQVFSILSNIINLSKKKKKGNLCPFFEGYEESKRVYFVRANPAGT